jgi:hypothetical protein
MQQFDRVRRASNCNSLLSFPMLQRSRQSDELTLRSQMGDAERCPQTSVMLAITAGVHLPTDSLLFERVARFSGGGTVTLKSL